MAGVSPSKLMMQNAYHFDENSGAKTSRQPVQSDDFNVKPTNVIENQMNQEQYDLKEAICK